MLSGAPGGDGRVQNNTRITGEEGGMQEKRGGCKVRGGNAGEEGRLQEKVTGEGYRVKSMRREEMPERKREEEGEWGNEEAGGGMAKGKGE